MEMVLGSDRRKGFECLGWFWRRSSGFNWIEGIGRGSGRWFDDFFLFFIFFCNWEGPGR